MPKWQRISSKLRCSRDHLCCECERLKVACLQKQCDSRRWVSRACRRGTDAAASGVEGSDAKLKAKIDCSLETPLQCCVWFCVAVPCRAISQTFSATVARCSLAYQDITAATGSGHDDPAKAVAAVGHADDTGYAGATTNVYAAGAVLINEIMWGLDGADTTSQYIELHNTTAADIGIDFKEWVSRGRRCTYWLHCH